MEKAINEFSDSDRIDIKMRIQKLKNYLTDPNNSTPNDYCINYNISKWFDKQIEKRFPDIKDASKYFNHCDKCINNNKEIFFKDFNDIYTIKEYILSGMSIECQNNTFNK